MRFATQIEVSQDVIRDAIRPALQDDYIRPVVVQYTYHYGFEQL